MDVVAYYTMLLQQICQRLFPGHLIEIREHPAGLWPYILNPDGEEVPNYLIAQRLGEYRERKRGDFGRAHREEDGYELRALSATREAIEIYGALAPANT